ncbi:MAG: DNA-binding protein [Candidatus Hydrogenedentes bacterium]|nr:DNA-binding protein [Candidatus Hydrogenedentota bacterium]MBI3119508.1 DNA-binding protein [Candidatus Hydrogenedentota bacterium]
MQTLAVPISEEQFEQLQRRAEELRVSPETLAQAGIADFLAVPDDTFTAAADQILARNAELYRRLA